MAIIPAAMIAAQVASKAVGTGAEIAETFADANAIYTEDDERRIRNIQKMLNADAVIPPEQQAQYFQGIPEAEREAYSRAMSDTAPYDIGSGFFGRQQLARGEALREQTALKQAELRKREEAERIRLRGEEETLVALERDEDRAKKAARWKAVGSVARAVPEVMGILGEQTLMLQEMRQMDEEAGLSQAESSIAGDVATQYSG